MRLAIYCDYAYRLGDDRLSAQEPVGLFFAGVASHFAAVTMTGRLDEGPGDFPYAMPGVGFVPLPSYASGADARALLTALPRSIAAFWRVLGGVDAAWVFGPTFMAVVFAFLTLIRRRRLILGVRADLPRLFAHRYPDRPLLRGAAQLLDAIFRLLSRRAPVTVVGPDLARRYAVGRSVHTMYVSVLHADQLAPATAGPRDWEAAELRILSVGRLDPEKNPLLLADILAGAVAADPRWRLEICGTGPLQADLCDRLDELGVADRAVLRGHVPVDGGLTDLYRECHVLLHVSLTEGVPQVLLEAFAQRLPVIATAVGGVPGIARGCALLIGPGDSPSAVRALGALADDPALRDRLTRAGADRAREHTLESEAARVTDFIDRRGGR